MTIAKTMSQGTLQRVVAQERDAGFEVALQFAPLEVGGFWRGYTPKTPPFVVPVRNQSHVQGFAVQHILNMELSGTETLAYMTSTLTS
ncbi:hypothetical protein ACFP9V_23385 [Deinococcus radiopugnans]|uniref:hypothetical protein n=1 Tax=Deinococcus radiopugnans TaxID=57497 RepID=UPI001476F0A6|nr:hypothetical protein [Deinococcus radiopugnans]